MYNNVKGFEEEYGERELTQIYGKVISEKTQSLLLYAMCVPLLWNKND